MDPQAVQAVQALLNDSMTKLGASLQDGLKEAVKELKTEAVKELTPIVVEQCRTMFEELLTKSMATLRAEQEAAIRDRVNGGISTLAGGITFGGVAILLSQPFLLAVAAAGVGSLAGWLWHETLKPAAELDRALDKALDKDLANKAAEVVAATAA